jgi:hypothetical protein
MARVVYEFCIFEYQISSLDLEYSSFYSVILLIDALGIIYLR